MKSAIAFSVCYQAITIIVCLATIFYILLCVCSEIVFIYQIISCVIWWIYVYHLHFAKITFAQKLQNIQVVAFYVKILSVVEINALLTARTQRLINWSVCSNDRLLLSWPGKLVTFLIALYYAPRKILLQLIEVDS